MRIVAASATSFLSLLWFFPVFPPKSPQTFPNLFVGKRCVELIIEDAGNPFYISLLFEALILVPYLEQTLTLLC